MLKTAITMSHEKSQHNVWFGAHATLSICEKRYVVNISFYICSRELGPRKNRLGIVQADRHTRLTHIANELLL